MNYAARNRGCLLGLACGDAVGTTVEFCLRGSFPPVTDMVGGGPFNLPVGAWTDDTSMALCLASSLVELGRFDAADQMRRYCDWQRQGYLSSIGRCFDIGVTINAALAAFQRTGNPHSGSVDPYSAGNGSIMRLAPVPIFFQRDLAAAQRWSEEISKTTHGTLECLEACRLLAAMLVAALSGADKESILTQHDVQSYAALKIQTIVRGEYRNKEDDSIRGTGYVIKSLEAAVWAFWKTENFRDAILTAVNLGDDADTTGAVCGQLAGAFYGEEGIPAAWRTRLVMADLIINLADRLGEMGTAPSPQLP